jgi:hypothetical protein
VGESRIVEPACWLCIRTCVRGDLEIWSEGASLHVIRQRLAGQDT